MKSLLFVAAGIALTVTCWGAYGPVLHEGQHALGNSRLKPLICVGAAYLVVAIALPLGILALQGQLAGGWNAAGITWSCVAGIAGALGAMGIILALSSGGKPIYVMPIVFGGAPVVTTFVSMFWHKTYKQGINPLFFVGLILVVAGAATVLRFAPTKGPANAKVPADAIGRGSGEGEH